MRVDTRAYVWSDTSREACGRLCSFVLNVIGHGRGQEVTPRSTFGESYHIDDDVGAAIHLNNTKYTMRVFYAF